MVSSLRLVDELSKDIATCSSKLLDKDKASESQSTLGVVDEQQDSSHSSSSDVEATSPIVSESGLFPSDHEGDSDVSNGKGLSSGDEHEYE